MGGRARRGSPREGTSALTAFKEILRCKAGTLGLEPAYHLVESREAWAGIVGPTLARASRVLSLRGGVLVVAADHPLVAQEIRMRRGEILAALSGRLGASPKRLQVVIRAKGQNGGNAH